MDICVMETVGNVVQRPDQNLSVRPGTSCL